VDVREHRRGKDCPVSEWLASLDSQVRARIISRVGRVRNGNFGDHKSVGGGVSELRMAFGAGYRVYYGVDGQTVVILLCGGDKFSQQTDIEKAKAYWKNYNAK